MPREPVSLPAVLELAFIPHRRKAVSPAVTPCIPCPGLDRAAFNALSLNPPRSTTGVHRAPLLRLSNHTPVAPHPPPSFRCAAQVVSPYTGSLVAPGCSQILPIGEYLQFMHNGTASCGWRDSSLTPHHGQNKTPSRRSNSKVSSNLPKAHQGPRTPDRSTRVKAGTPSQWCSTKEPFSWIPSMRSTIVSRYRAGNRITPPSRPGKEAPMLIAAVTALTAPYRSPS